MDIIKKIIQSMMTTTLVENGETIQIDCYLCGKINSVNKLSVYRQNKRGNAKYICRSCAGKKGWSKISKYSATERTKNLWKNPNYAGTIVGKAIAREIIKKSEKE